MTDRGTGATGRLFDDPTAQMLPIYVVKVPPESFEATIERNEV